MTDRLSGFIRRPVYNRVLNGAASQSWNRATAARSGGGLQLPVVVFSHIVTSYVRSIKGGIPFPLCSFSPTPTFRLSLISSSPFFCSSFLNFLLFSSTSSSSFLLLRALLSSNLHAILFHVLPFSLQFAFSLFRCRLSQVWVRPLGRVLIFGGFHRERKKWTLKMIHSRVFAFCILCFRNLRITDLTGLVVTIIWR